MLKRILKNLFILIILIAIIIIVINLIMISATHKQIITNAYAKKLKNIDCILILGAGIRGNAPSLMLEDRLVQGIKLYQDKVSPKIIASGDHINDNYDEVNVMKDYLVGHKVPSQDVFMDHAGISTYDSIYRAKEIFKAKKVIIITQKYHLYRSLYIAQKLGLEAYGVSADIKQYKNQEIREIREFIARPKDFIKSILKQKSKYLGNTISLEGNGDTTNDK